MKRKILLFLGSLIILTSIVACTPQTASPTSPSTKNQTAKSYPVDNILISPNDAYPVGTIDNQTILPRGPDFSIDRPVLDGTTILTGTGPADVPIDLIDVFQGGTLLGSTKIDSNGNFVFNLDTPLIKGHSIGIILGDVSHTDFSESDFFYNENYYDMPYIGILFDFLVVE